MHLQNCPNKAERSEKSQEKAKRANQLKWKENVLYACSVQLGEEELASKVQQVQNESREIHEMMPASKENVRCEMANDVD